jgi:hypothetical protein
MKKFALAAGLIIFLASSADAADGISSLLQINQMKAYNANQQTLLAADKQSSVVRQQQRLRRLQERTDAMMGCTPSPCKK